MRKNDKRNRLVQAADALFHEQGVNTTTLANIAERSDVPLGNVYYYFKSKEAIVLAVVAYRKQVISHDLENLNHLPEGMARLEGLLDQLITATENAQFGDPLGSLCQELSKQPGAPAQAIAELLQEFIIWVEKQLKASGQVSENTLKLASYFVANIQGIHLMTLTLKDIALSKLQCHALKQWLLSL